MNLKVAIIILWVFDGITSIQPKLLNRMLEKYYKMINESFYFYFKIFLDLFIFYKNANTKQNNWIFHNMKKGTKISIYTK